VETHVIVKFDLVEDGIEDTVDIDDDESAEDDEDFGEDDE
jgi:hypothetical protein